MREQISEKVKLLPPISLKDMSGIKLMNRTDTKFVATLEQLNNFLLAVQGKYYIQEHNNTRIASYHTVYLDTADYIMYTMHHNGKTRREKIRVRTYLDSKDTFLEVKNKNNHGRTKKKRITVGGVDTLKEEQENVVPFLAKHGWYNLEELMPTCENRFSRITLVNYEKTERLTIDFDLRFHHFATDDRDELKRVAIIELKRDGNVPSPALAIIRDLRIRRSGFSKYCVGSARTNKNLRRNNFKERLRFIDRLEYKQ
jgi:hypothetical protein